MVALGHDILLTIGIYSLSGRMVTADTIAAVLTVLGYSMYDTVIVFDRVRENIPILRRMTASKIVNESLAETITRSLNTTLVTLIPVVLLFVFGVGLAEGLRLRADRRHRIGRLLVDLHRRAAPGDAHGARAGLRKRRATTSRGRATSSRPPKPTAAGRPRCPRPPSRPTERPRRRRRTHPPAPPPAHGRNSVAKRCKRVFRQVSAAVADISVPHACRAPSPADRRFSDLIAVIKATGRPAVRRRPERGDGAVRARAGAALRRIRLPDLDLRGPTDAWSRTGRRT